MEQYLFDKDVYIQRRANLVKSMQGKGIAVFMGNSESPMNYRDNAYSFRQDSSFLYFFGLDVPDQTAIIDLESGDATIFGAELTIDDMIWTGPMPALKELAALAGVQLTDTPAAFEERIAKALQTKRAIHILPPYRGDNSIRLATLLHTTPKALAAFASQELVQAVIALREIKEARELEQMDEAVNISNEMHLKGMRFARAGMKEYEVAAQIEAIAKSRNGRFSYPIIFTVNGETLHNHGQHNTLEEGRLVLCDTGAENRMHYAGDLTRTFPVSKKFTTQQRDIYNLVLSAMDHSIGLLKPGITYSDVHRAASEVIVDGLKALGLMKGDTKEAVETGAHALFLPHGLGHMIGLDVHDMEDLGEDNVGYSSAVKRKTLFGWKSLRLGKELKEGLVLTVEPGIYFIPGLIDKWSAQQMHTAFINYDRLDAYRNFGGIRIEDNYTITGDGSRKLGGYLAKTAEEIEELRN